MIQFKRNSLFIAFTALTLTACGGGGSGSSDSPTTDSNTPTATSTSSIQGVAADGYLESAKACFDTNDNKKCDVGEPSANTDAEGKFTLDGIPTADKDKHGVVIEIVAGQTIDKDDTTGTPLTKSYTLTAPPGKPEFVSPITTMIHTKMEKDGSTAADAEKLVKQDMGFTQDDTIDLFEDYVKNANDTTHARKDDFNKIHKIAKITASILGNNKDKIEAAAKAANQDPADLAAEIVNLVVQKVIDQLQSIEKIADAKKDDSEFSDTDLKDLTTVVSITDITTDLDKEKETRTTTTSTLNIEDLMVNKGGITSFRVDKNRCSSSVGCNLEFTSNNIQFTKDSAGLLMVKEAKTVYNDTTKTWVEKTVSDNNSLLLTATGFELTKDSTNTFTVSGNSATEIKVGGLKVEHQFVKSLDLSGLKLRSFLGESDDERNDLDEKSLDSDAAVFSANAQAFKFATKYVEDIYESPLENNEGKCHNTDLPAYVDTSSNCNSVRVVNPSGIADTTAITFSDIMTASSTDKKAIGVRQLLLKIVGDTSSTSGDAFFLKKGNTSESTDSDGTVFSTTTWSKKTINGVEMILVKLSTDVQREGSFDGQPSELIFFVKDSFVRFGALTLNGTFSIDREFFFNTTGAQDVKDHFVVPVASEESSSASTEGPVIK